MKQFISYSEKETISFAKSLASKLNIGDVIILSGDLGSGKTKFTEGILTYFGLENEISSPTFTIVNEYHSNKLDIYHFDLYRLADIDEFYAIGGDEYFSKGLCIIEWGEKIEELLPKSYLKISFSRDFEDSDIRILELECFGDYKIKEV